MPYKVWADQDVLNAADLNAMTADASTNEVAAFESTASSSYGDLTTVGPAVTLTLVSGQGCLVYISARASNDADVSTSAATASLAVTGASALAALDSNGIRVARTAGILVTRISGTPEMRLWMSIDNKPDANLTAYLVDYGPPGATAAPFVVSRGWMDPQNRLGPDRSRPVRQGRLATYRWVLQPKDYVFPAGHRVGLVVFSSDQEYTLLPLGGTRLTVDPGSSRLTLPVVGARAAALG